MSPSSPSRKRAWSSTSNTRHIGAALLLQRLVIGVQRHTHQDSSSSAWGALHPQRAAERFGSLTHAGQAERARRRGKTDGWLEAHPIVANLEFKPSIVRTNDDPNVVCIGVLANIRERLLHNPEHVHADQIGHLSWCLRGVKGDRDAVALLEFVQVITQRRHQSPL